MWPVMNKSTHSNELPKHGGGGGGGIDAAGNGMEGAGDIFSRRQGEKKCPRELN